MKRSFLFFIFSIVLIPIFSQSPQSFKYQTVCRDQNGALLVNQLVSFKMSIVQDTPSGNVVYLETHQVATNDFGVVNIAIGNGSVVQGNFSSIDWANHSFFVKVDYDRYGQNNYQFMGTSELLSVPFALYANKAKESTKSLNDQDTSSTNEIQTLSLNGNQLQISNGNSVTITGVLDLDADPTNEYQQLSINGNAISISNGNTISIPAEADGNPTNEFQNLSINGNTISISNGNSINLSDNSATNEFQNLSINGNTLSISNGNSINLSDNSATNEIQVLTVSNDTIFLSNGGFAVVPSKTPFYINNSTTDAGGNKQTTIYRDGAVGIGSDNTPESSAQLDVNATDKGFLPPRVALQATNNPLPITSPAAGLLVYNTATAGTPPNNVKPGYYYWKGLPELSWEKLYMKEEFLDFYWDAKLNGNPVSSGITNWAAANLGGNATFNGSFIQLTNSFNQDGYVNFNLNQIDFSRDIKIEFMFYFNVNNYDNFSFSIGGDSPCLSTNCPISNGSLKWMNSPISGLSGVYINNIQVGTQGGLNIVNNRVNVITLLIKSIRGKKIALLYTNDIFNYSLDITNWSPPGHYFSIGFDTSNWAQTTYVNQILFEYLNYK
jgi:hypothetical protein